MDDMTGSTVGSSTVSEATRAWLASGPLPMLVSDRWQQAAAGRTLAAVDPSTGSAIAHVALGGAEDVDTVAAAARQAFESGEWRLMNPRDKTRILLRFADLVDAHAPELAELEAIDVGKPITGARQEVALAADVLRYYAGWVSKVYGSTNPTAAGVLSYTNREPIGVVLTIMPWNGPAMLSADRLGATLAFGNVAILKPAESAMLTTLRMAALALEAGLPAGTVQVITGVGDEVGSALVRHADVDLIAFTGSTRAGRHIASAAGARLRHAHLELGGKGPQVVLPDADMEAMVARAFSHNGVWRNAGQICSMGSRWIVDRTVVEEFVERVAVAAEAVVVGRALEEETQMGPLVSEGQLSTVQGYVRAGHEDGAVCVAGGDRREGDGYFHSPTVFKDVDPSSRIAQEEIFGPVIAVISAGDEDEAVAIANGTPYGLTGGVWTEDIRAGHRIAERLRCGVVNINTYAELDWSVPFGGMGDSGLGREHGTSSVDVFTKQKSVYLRHGTS